MSNKIFKSAEIGVLKHTIQEMGAYLAKAQEESGIKNIEEIQIEQEEEMRASKVIEDLEKSIDGSTEGDEDVVSQKGGKSNHDKSEAVITSEVQVDYQEILDEDRRKLKRQKYMLEHKQDDDNDQMNSSNKRKLKYQQINDGTFEKAFKVYVQKIEDFEREETNFIKDFKDKCGQAEEVIGEHEVYTHQPVKGGVVDKKNSPQKTGKSRLKEGGQVMQVLVKKRNHQDISPLRKTQFLLNRNGVPIQRPDKSFSTTEDTQSDIPHPF